jgi:hypothetical protein
MSPVRCTDAISRSNRADTDGPDRLHAEKIYDVSTYLRVVHDRARLEIETGADPTRQRPGAPPELTWHWAYTTEAVDAASTIVEIGTWIEPLHAENENHANPRSGDMSLLGSKFVSASFWRFSRFRP